MLLLCAWALVRAGAMSLATPPATDAARLALVESHLNELEHALRHDDAAATMQRIFPEGASFLLTLYGLAWANLAMQTDDAALRNRALGAIRETLREHDGPAATEPFVDTEVRNGVFWLGEHNLLLGAYLEAARTAGRQPDAHDEALAAEFHDNSRALAEAFLASPTHHLDSYPQMCWPADNVTALVSLCLHDRLYGTNYRAAYEAWKRWTIDHSDPRSGLPHGRIDNRRGYGMEPARGCANSWITALLAREDPAFARELYARYADHFKLRRLGFDMFRETEVAGAVPADVDSGPVIWGAGMTATGVGLAAARACDDPAMYADIHALAGALGWPDAFARDGLPMRRHLFGVFPMGDAFLAWGHSLPVYAGQSGFSAPLAAHRLRRLPFLAVLFVLLALLAFRQWLAWRRLRRAAESSRPESAAAEGET